MSALGHKRTFRSAIAMSALSLKADIRSADTDVRFGPIADIDAQGQLQYIPRHLGFVGA
jgi:hypothetical protein